MNGSPQTARAWAALATRLAACGSALQAELAPALAAVDLNESEFALLWLLEQTAAGEEPARGPWHQRLLAQRLGVSPGHVCAVVERMRERGLVVSRRLEADRRRQFWEVSASGRRVVAELLDHLSAWAARRENCLGRDHRVALTKLLDQLATTCRESPADQGSGKEAA